MSKRYISDVDKLLQEFDRLHPREAFSESRNIVINTYKRIFLLREKIVPKQGSKIPWQDF